MSRRKPIVIPAIIFLMVLGGYARAVETYPQITSFGVYGDSPSNLKNPYGVAVDETTGEIYVVDTGHSAIKKFSAFGSFINSFGVQGTEDGQFQFPQGIALDGNGYLYVVDTAGHRVQKFLISGTGLTFDLKFGSQGAGNGQFNLPRDVEIDANGNVYVCDSGNNRIAKFDSSGTWIGSIGSTALKGPYGLGLDKSGNIYVADTYNHRVVKFDPNGAVLMRIGYYGQGAGRFVYPRDAAIDENGNIFVSDTENHRIQKFDGSGNYLNSFGVYTEFLTPQKIIIGNDGRLVSVDSNTNRIQVYDVTSYITDILISPNPFSPDDDGIDDIARIHYTIAEPSRVTINIFENNGNPVRTLISGAEKLTDKNTETWDGKNDLGVLVPAGNYTVKIDAVNSVNYHAPQESESVSVIYPTGQVSGAVSDGTTPIAGATVSDGTRSGVTDANGYYLLTNVPGGEFVISASKAGFKSGRKIVNVIEEGVITGVDFALDRVGDPDIRVTPASLDFMGTVGTSATGTQTTSATETQVQTESSVEPRDYVIKLKSRRFVPERHDGKSQKKIADKAGKLRKDRIHLLVQLDDIPTGREKKALREAGVELLSYIPEGAWLAGVKSQKAAKIHNIPKVRWAGILEPEDKISPEILKRGAGKWNRNADFTADLGIRFFKDVLKEEAEELIARYGGRIKAESNLGNVYTVSFAESLIAEIAGEDIVQWIEDVPPPPEEHNDGIRAATNVDGVQAGPYNLSGSNVTVGIWDGGHVDNTHYDLAGSVVYGDSETVEEHATHVAGTTAGNGYLSALIGGLEGQWKGMAPGSRIISYEWTDSVAEHQSAINDHWIDISQNSWGYVVDEAWLDNCSFYGDYSSTVGEYDAIVKGGFGKPIGVVFSAGNERNDTDCDIPANGGYATIPPPATGKNIISVGAINSDDNGMTTFSSWGPVDDGRIKPDLVAPGCETGGEQYIHSTLPGSKYGGPGWCGTSMAAPAVSGISALLIEQAGKTFGAAPLPSTIKAVLVHTATDLETPGPDFKTGYGLINAEAAVDMIADKALIEGSVSSTGVIKTYSIQVPEGAPELKVTIAWDDEPGVPNSSPALVNDLDLDLTSPDGSIYRPWKPDPANPGDAASTGIDSINNVEQVWIANPLAGQWTVSVKGTAVPNPAQNYSLVSGYFGDGELKYAVQKLFTIYNDGDTDLTVSGIGKDREWISLNQPAATVTPGNSVVVKVTVDSTGLNYGTHSGQINIDSNDPNEALVTIPVSYFLNGAPSADPGGPYTVIEGQAVTLDGSGSADPDGTIVLYEWDIDNDGVNDYSSSSPGISHTYAAQGTYTVGLRVTDDLGAVGDAAATTVTVSDASPDVDFAGSPLSGIAPLTVSFTNYSSGYDQPLSYQWDFNNDGITDSNGQDPSFTFDSPGTYTVVLTVTDGDGSISSNVKTDYIYVPQTALLNVSLSGTGTGRVESSPAGIDCGSDCSELFIKDDQVTLTAIADPDMVFSLWTGTGCTTSESCVIVMNSDLSITAEFSVALPVSVFSAAPTTGYDPLKAAFTDQSTGIISSRLWDFGDGHTSAGKDPEHIFTDPGTYVISLTVTNISGSNTSSTTLTVQPCGNDPVRIPGTPPVYYPDLQSAYDAALDGETIQIQAKDLIRDLDADRAVSVTLDGGYDCDYSSKIGTTGIKGDIITNNGTLTTNEIILNQ